MTDSIRFNSFIIQDHNHNNLYDPTLDAVTDLKGRALSSAEVQRKTDGLLAQTGAAGWNGLWLRETAEILSKRIIAHRTAGELAKKGDLIGTRNVLRDIRSTIRRTNRHLNLNIPINMDLAKVLMKKAFRNSIIREWKNAAKLAHMGKMKELEPKLREIRNLTFRGRRQFRLRLDYSKKRENMILELGLRQGVKLSFKEATRFANKGDLSKTNECLHLAKRYAQEHQRRFAGQPNFPTVVYDSVRASALRQCAKGLGACP